MLIASPRKKEKVTVKKRYLFGLLLSLAAIATMITACDDGSGTPQTTGTVQDATQYCNPSTSLACKEVQARYKLFEDSEQYGYFYGFESGVAQPVVVYITRGGVFPLDDMVTPPDKVVACNNGSSSCGVVQQNQQPDGTWGTNGIGVFGFRADGQYFEWGGQGLGYAFSFQQLTFFHPANVVGCPTKASTKSAKPALCS